MSKQLKTWKYYLQDEIDAAWLYGKLYEKSTSENDKKLFKELEQIENEHARRWLELIEKEGHVLDRPKVSTKAKITYKFAKWYGMDFLKNKMLAEEGKEVKIYLDLYKKSQGPTKDLALDLARDSAIHANQLSDDGVEPWHQHGVGGLLRNIVYGFNDGLTANFGLMAGVIGAASSDKIILLTGLAGMIADALSMGSSGYLAAKSEQEVFDYEKEMERQEILLMPDLETKELIAIYRLKGMTEEQATIMATELMKDPEKALAEKIKEELHISESSTSPVKEAWLTGTATAIGAAIPILPFLFTDGKLAIWISFSIAMLAHFGVGAIRALFTGRGFWRSGFDMFIVGFGVAAIGYYVGEWVLKYFM